VRVDSDRPLATSLADLPCPGAPQAKTAAAAVIAP
jgi:hypothetical protein